MTKFAAVPVWSDIMWSVQHHCYIYVNNYKFDMILFGGSGYRKYGWGRWDLLPLLNWEVTS